MRIPSHKQILVGLLLNCLTFGAVLAQSPTVTPLAAPGNPGRIALGMHTGLSSYRLPIGLSLRVGLSPHLAVDAGIATDPWRDELASDVRVAGGQLREAKLTGRALTSVGITAYTKPGRGGFFGAVAAGVQGYQVDATTRLDPPPPNDNNVCCSGYFPLDLLVAILFTGNGNGRAQTRTINTSGTAINLSGRIGYAFAFQSGQRLELSARMATRSLGSK